MEKHFIIQLLDKTFHYTTIGQNISLYNYWKTFPLELLETISLYNYWKKTFHDTTIGKEVEKLAPNDHHSSAFSPVALDNVCTFSYR